MTFADPSMLTAQRSQADAPARARALGDRFINVLCFALAGYAIGGRGFAYTGYPPVFIGELTLLLGIVAVLMARGWDRMLLDAHTWPIFVMIGWGLSRTLPYVSEFGIDSLRDGMSWGYSAFAIILAIVLIERPERLGRFVARYRRFIPLFLVGILFAFVAFRFMGQSRPEWPWVAVPILQVKEGDVLVHISGVTAFWVSGLAGKPKWKWIGLLTLLAGTMGVIDRAGMVAFGAVCFMCVLLRPMNNIGIRLVATVAILLAVLWASDIRLPLVNGKGRDISFDQIIVNVTSVLSDSGSDGLDSTKEWRKEWWKAIINYTFNGSYYWSGKGYGINLADDDGFQVLTDHSLRNPHSAHMTMLARGGVPMLGLWVLVNAVWFSAMFRALLHSRRHACREWEGLFFVLLAYWVALMINGSFDVYLEGPAGGIWFWCVYGAGLAASSIYRRDPRLFRLPPLPIEHQPAVSPTAVPATGAAV